MLITSKSQRQLYHCLPSQDTVPRQPKACQGASAPARDVYPCPEPGNREHRHVGGTKDRRCPSGVRGSRRTSVTLWQQQGAAGCTWGAGSEVQQDSFAPFAHPSLNPQSREPSAIAHSLAYPCPTGCPKAGRGNREMCTSAERADGGEDEPDNYYLESLTRVPSKIMAQILRKGAL